MEGRKFSQSIETEKMQLLLIGATNGNNSSSGSKTSSGKEHDIPAENPTSDLGLFQNIERLQASQILTTSIARAKTKVTQGTKTKSP